MHCDSFRDFFLVDVRWRPSVGVLNAPSTSFPHYRLVDVNDISKEEMKLKGEEHMGKTIYGYARVSAKDQNLDRQVIALGNFPVRKDRIFADKASGKDFERPAYKRLVSSIEPGDVVVVKSIDRLGRNYNEILEEWRFLTREKRCAIVVIDMPLLDTRESQGGLTGVFIADLVLQVLSYVAQVERDNTKQRQAEGIAAAKARGVRFGRPPKRRPSNYSSVRKAFLAGEMSRKEAAALLCVGVTTFAKWLKEDDLHVTC